MAHRLPRTVLPRNYSIEMSPDLEARTFTGSVRVAAEVVDATTTLTCNCVGLEIQELLVDGCAAEFQLDAADETLTVDLGGDRQPGPIELFARFSGELTDQLRGFYASTFTDEEGVEQVIATTQFQSTDARRAFPCWDEPDLKATFDVTLVVETGSVAVSNGAEVDRVVRADGRTAVRFATTMVMSTYVVAFVVGPLEITEPVLAGTVPIRIVHRPGRAHLTGFALDVAKRALDYFEQYYGLPYPADKLDMIALPDFAWGAMENVGCVTYRELLVLVDPDSATQNELRDVADVVNHELAHMWFGNLVTMRWWDGIWLNEAFATFMEMKATDRFRPEWRRWDDFGMSRSVAFDTDGLSSTRPIEFPVDSPEDAEAMFDSLTYQKGAAVVRMLEQWLGEDAFRRGIVAYLSRHAHGNTETKDLWAALETQADRPITEAMDSWIRQGGFPAIEPRDGELRQRRFGYTTDLEPGNWHVPIQTRTAAGEIALIELDSPSTVLETRPADIVTFNHHGHGFYRVKLPPERLRDIGRHGTSQLEPVERFGLIDDTWALTLADQVSLEDFFAFLEGFTSEVDLSVWQRIIAALSLVHHVAADDQLDALATKVECLTSRSRAEVGDVPRADESPRTRQLRGALFGAVGTLAPTLGRVDRARSIHDDAGADPDLAAASVSVIAAGGTDHDFADFRRRYEDAQSPQEMVRYLDALAAFPSSRHLHELVDMALGGVIRIQDAPSVLGLALANRRHGPEVWTRVETSWPTIVDRFPSNTIGRLLQGVRALSDPPVARRVVDFFADRPIPVERKRLDQHLERLAVNSRFRERVARDLGAALS